MWGARQSRHGWFGIPSDGSHPWVCALPCRHFDSYLDVDEPDTLRKFMNYVCTQRLSRFVRFALDVNAPQLCR